MKLEEAVEFMSAEAKRQTADSFDVIGVESDESGVEVFEGKVKSTEIASSRGIGIRLFRDGRPGIAYTEKFSMEAIKQAVTDATAHSKITDKMELDLPEGVKLLDLDLESYKEEVDKISFDQMIRLGMELEQIALSQDKKIVNVPFLGVSKSSGRSVIQNSKGVNYAKRANAVSAGLGVVAKEGDSSKMGVYSNGGRSYSIFDTDYMSKKAVERALELLGAEPVESKQYPVVFSNRVSSGIIGMFLAPYYAELVQKGQSRLADKINQKISVDDFTMTCNPHLPGFPGSRLFDSEGVATKITPIIKNGVLQTFLYNLESSKKAGIAPTGNGSRSYAGKAGTGTSNLIVDKGTRSVEELLAVYPECIYVTKLEGSSGCSAISGEISIGVQGFLYQNGKRIRPIDRITLNSNYFDLLPLIRGLSNEYNDSFSSMKVPDILVESMYVAG
jgi:PmbA protein